MKNQKVKFSSTHTSRKFLFIISLLGVFLKVSALSAQSKDIYEEVSGLVAVEAEHYRRQKADNIRQWQLYKTKKTLPGAEGNISAEASGNAYLQIMPDTRKSNKDRLIPGENFSNIPGQIAILEYSVYFNTPGKYYVWASCYSAGAEDNGLHVGINGTWPESGQRMQWCKGKKSWYWDNAQRTKEVHCGVPGKIFLEVPAAGLHTVAFSMREDGFKLDKWLLTKDSAFARPTGAGPAEKIYRGPAKASPPTGAYQYEAIKDFEILNSGAIPYYIDKKNMALAINAANVPYRDKFARAATIFRGNTDAYDVTLTTLAEFDGESTYRLLVNGKEIGAFKNSRIGQAEDYKRLTAVFRSVKLAANDTLAVESNSHTNGLIPEKESTAWSRGRWSGLRLEPARKK